MHSDELKCSFKPYNAVCTADSRVDGCLKRPCILKMKHIYPYLHILHVQQSSSSLAQSARRPLKDMQLQSTCLFIKTCQNQSDQIETHTHTSTHVHLHVHVHVHVHITAWHELFCSSFGHHLRTAVLVDRWHAHLRSEACGSRPGPQRLRCVVGAAVAAQ